MTYTSHTGQAWSRYFTCTDRTDREAQRNIEHATSTVPRRDQRDLDGAHWFILYFDHHVRLIDTVYTLPYFCYRPSVAWDQASTMAPPQSWKGKRRAHSPTRNGQSSGRPIPPAAYIQAYEAQLVYDRVEIAQELSTPVDDLPESSRARGRGLLRWQGDTDRNVWADR